MNQQAMQADDPHARQKILHRGAAVDEAAAAVIAVHGRGATAEDILSLHRFADRADVAWLAPQAASFTWYPNSFL
ncbi:MAG: phospholipase, partial [Bacteroidota bacterium]